MEKQYTQKEKKKFKKNLKFGVKIANIFWAGALAGIVIPNFIQGWNETSQNIGKPDLEKKIVREYVPENDANNVAYSNPYEDSYKTNLNKGYEIK